MDASNQLIPPQADQLDQSFERAVEERDAMENEKSADNLDQHSKIEKNDDLNDREGDFKDYCKSYDCSKLLLYDILVSIKNYLTMI